MTQATLSQELTRQSLSLARALSAAARNWALYPWERDSRGAFPKAVVESMDPDSIDVDPLTVV
jgi:hypothetical protein